MNTRDCESNDNAIKKQATQADHPLTIQVWLHEHKMLREEVHEYMISLRNLITIDLAVFAGILAAVTSNPDELWPLFLIIPFSSFTIGSLTHYYLEGIFTIAKYVHQKIRPALSGLTGDNDVMGWDNFVNAERQARTRLQKFVTMPGLMFVVFTLPSTAALLFAGTQLQWQFHNIPWSIIFFTGAILLIVQFIGFILLARFIFNPFSDSKKPPREDSSSMRAIAKDTKDPPPAVSDGGQD